MHALIGASDDAPVGVHAFDAAKYAAETLGEHGTQQLRHVLPTANGTTDGAHAVQTRPLPSAS
jgi:hypothetical protein